ncbi:MAG: ATP phosphoribosyltransferase regulatory subunit [Candidatus Margulisiibacteriota bacterium]|jgi:ATP phosphoribosyltransferase regulatory subunit
MTNFTPSGIKDFTPEETFKHESIIKKIKEIFIKNDYQKIITPTIEYFEIINKGLGESLAKKAVKFLDLEGHTLILRPDFTTPIARLVATRMKHTPKPIRLYYSDQIFRNNPKKPHEEIEIFQTGIELIGADSPESEAEVISLGIEALLNLGYENFGVDIGHIDFITNLSEEKKEALIKGNYVDFGTIPPIGQEEIINDYPNLQKVYNLLIKKGYKKYIRFNKGLIKDINYYTGIIFEFYIEGFGHSIGSGGRYDNLIKKFGLDLPAIGFSLDINKIIISQEKLSSKL